MPPDEATLRDAGFKGLRVVGDVHGDIRGFRAAVEGAAAGRLYVVQLGDLIDHGPDSVGVLRAMLALRDTGAGSFLLGNHDHKLRRALAGGHVRVEAAGLGRTLAELAAIPDAELLRRRVMEAIAAAPAWLRLGARGFVHAAWDARMARQPAPDQAGARRPDPLVARAMFGHVSGFARPDGFPDRLYGWVDPVPAGFGVYCGHDTRSADGRPLVQTGAAGGTVVFLDTGAGKGGHLSWVDLPL